MLTKPLQPAVLFDLREEVADISIEHDVHLLARDPDRESRPTHHAAGAPVVSRTRTQDSPPHRWRSRHRPPPAEGSCRPTKRPRAAASRPSAFGRTPSESASPGTRPHGPEQIPMVGFEVCPLVPPCDAVKRSGGVGADRPISLPQTVDCHMMRSVASHLGALHMFSSIT
jgi:hypothetical protein